jgi:hypothetical protein
MINIGFVGCLAAAFFFLFRWAFKALPHEKFQVMATVPLSKNPDGTWQGLNLTYYGFFTASAYLLATISVFVLLGSLNVPAGTILIITAIILLTCVPAAKSIARIVEKKAYTFSVGGAACIGILISPWVLLAVEKLPGLTLAPQDFVLPGMAALSIAYALGEGVGRLACISFGCCYGKPFEQVHPVLRRLVGFRSFVFTGKTKKVAYADRLDGQKLFPIQAVTATLYTACGLAGMLLFLEQAYAWAFVGTLVLTQAWRFFSEFLRSDFRGKRRITAYQIMALGSIPYAVLIAVFLPVVQAPPANLVLGLSLLGNPILIGVFIAIWTGLFLYTGRSRVTGATLRIYVINQNI